MSVVEVTGHMLAASQPTAAEGDAIAAAAGELAGPVRAR
jgi:hypothetical protein